MIQIKYVVIQRRILENAKVEKNENGTKKEI